MSDFYDDTILQFDQYFKDLIETLAFRGRLRDTIIVLHSDHGMVWKGGVRLPLIFIFPNRAHRSRP